MILNELFESLRTENPCWKGYHPVGTKKKDGRTVPNCVPNANEGVAEGLNDTIYPNAEVIKSKNGKPVGEIYQDGKEWGCFHYKADRGYDMIDSREDAIQALKDIHSETGRSRPDYTIKGVAEGSLSEVDRRGFLKGLGAAAVAGATGGALAQNKKFSAEEIQYIDEGLRVYRWLKSFGGDTKPWGLRVKRALDKISKLPGGKELLLNRWNAIRKEDASNEMYYARISFNAVEALNNLESIVEFDESVEQGVAEGSEQMVGFHLDSERAYEAVMAKFGHVIDHDEDSGTMYVPERLWPTVEATAYDADGIGAQRDDELENPEHYGVDEGEKVGNMDADKFDDAMARLKKLAGQGPMKTVWDPQKRVYRNVPTAQQSSKK